MSKSENGTIHTARLCHVIKQDNFDGYGFNLHAEKGKTGQYIGKVDDGSPAETAGLRQGDRILEVNGINIGNETHKQVVQRIKAIASEVQLLVVDPSVVITKENRIAEPSNGTIIVHDDKVDSSMKTSPPSSPSAVFENKSILSTPSPHESDTIHISITPPPANNIEEDSKSLTTSVKSTNDQSPTTVNNQNSSPVNRSEGVLNLNMTAAELRAKLAAKKKFDPKNDSVDLRKKFEIVQKL